jgi:hypothetical protein
MTSQYLSKAFLFFAILIVFGSFCIVIATQAGEEAKEKQTSEHDHDAMMEKLKEFSTPNENHKVLGIRSLETGTIRSSGGCLKMLSQRNPRERVRSSG